MACRKIIAIVRSNMMEAIEASLLSIGVRGITISPVSGYGEYHNFYKPDMMSEHIRIEIFCAEERAEAIAHCIIDAAHLGTPGDGVVAISPVEKLYRIRSGKPYDEIFE